MEEWTRHFKAQMNGMEIEEEGGEARTEEEVKEDGDEIGVKQIKAVIKKMKKKKAAGEDKIPNEAWICGEYEMLVDLHKVINRI